MSKQEDFAFNQERIKAQIEKLNRDNITFREMTDPSVPYEYSEADVKHIFNEGPASIVSKFNWMQEVWFVENGQVYNGRIQGIKGEVNRKWTRQPPTLEIDYTSPPNPPHSQMGCTFHVSEDRCFASEAELKEYLFPSK